MKVKKILWLSFTLFLLLIVSTYVADKTNSITPNGKIMYNHVNLVIDENDWYRNVGFSDYVFIGKVEKTLHNTISEDNPRTVYKVKVIENIKGALKKEVKIELNAGYQKDGTLLLNATDTLQEDGLPIVGSKYIFLGYAQPEGSILIAPIIGFREADEASRLKYIEYTIDQIPIERTRYSSIYEKE